MCAECIKYSYVGCVWVYSYVGCVQVQLNIEAYRTLLYLPWAIHLNYIDNSTDKWLWKKTLYKFVTVKADFNVSTSLT